MVDNTIDATLRRLGLGNFIPGNGSSMSALRHLLDTFNTNHGRGASGVNFFDVKDVTSPEMARDLLILKSLQEALNVLASNDFAPAFGKSTNQNDYYWGRLHRVAFNHRLGERFSIPTAAGFSHLSLGLSGIPMPVGFETVNGAGHSIRASSVNAFTSTIGQAGRFVSALAPGGHNSFMVIPGGESGDVRSQFYANMLKQWLANQYCPMWLTRKQVDAHVLSEQIFEPHH